MKRLLPIVLVLLAFWIGRESVAQGQGPDANTRVLRVKSIEVGDFANGAGVRLTPSKIEIRGKDEHGASRTFELTPDAISVHQLHTDFLWLGEAGSLLTKNRVLLRSREAAMYLTPEGLRVQTQGGDSTVVDLSMTKPDGEKSRSRSAKLVLRNHKNQPVVELPK